MTPIQKRRSRSWGLLTLVALVLCVSCSKDTVKPDENERALVSIEVVPDTARVEVGHERTFFAIGIYETGDPDTVAVIWSMSGDTIGTLDRAQGDRVTFLATAEGVGFVIATTGSRTDTARVITYDLVVAIDILPDSIRLAVDQSQLFQAVAEYEDGSVLPAAVDWRLIGGAIGTLSTDHGDSVMFHATAEGEGLITGTQGARRDSARIVTFEPELVSVFLTPTSAMLELGGEETFSAHGVYDTGDTSSIEVAWSLSLDPIGTISPSFGKSTVFRAASVGRAILTAEVSGFESSAELRAVFPSPYVIFDDFGVSDSLGTFDGGSGDIIGLDVVDDPEAPEGQNLLEVAFTVRETGWAGLFFEEGNFGPDSVAYMCHFMSEGYLRFWIKSTVDVRIGIRSENIPAGGERSKVWLRSDGYANLQGEWEEVAIPLHDFDELEQRLRCDQVAVFFMAAAEGRHYGNATSGTFKLDHIRWTKD